MLFQSFPHEDLVQQIYTVFQNAPISIASSRIGIYITQELTGKNLKAHKIKHLKSQANGIL